MKTLMYPIAPDDDFPEMFCAIRQGSGEHWFYTPEGESASWMLFRAVSENAKLREQMERLVTLLRADCDIEASWDGLRKFWSIGLTEDGCLMRDRACKAEADNAKLRELLSVMAYCNQFRRDCDGCSMNGAAGIITERAGCDELLDRLRELGVEVDG